MLDGPQNVSSKDYAVDPGITNYTIEFNLQGADSWLYPLVTLEKATTQTYSKIACYCSPV